MGHSDPGHQLEQLTGSVIRSARAAGSHVDLARIGVRIGDEFADVISLKRRIDRHEIRKAPNTSDRCDVAHEIEAETFVVSGVDRIRRVDQEQVVAIRRRTYDRLGCDVGCRAGPVLHQELLLKPLREPLADQTRRDVNAPTRGIANQDTHRVRRIFR